MKGKDDEKVFKPGYESPKMSSLDAKQPLYGGGPGPDDCLDGSSAVSGGCSAGLNAGGEGGQCIPGGAAASNCQENGNSAQGECLVTGNSPAVIPDP